MSSLPDRAVVATMLCAALVACSAGAVERGVDLGSLPQVEAGGAAFTEDVVGLLAARGVDAVRLRVWHTPADGHGGRAAAVDLATRAHRAGLKILLDLHYSDTWADPAHQTPPAAWSGRGRAALTDSVRTWTADVLADFAARALPVDAVQIGNEITNGMLWPIGRVGGAFDRAAQWEAFAGLLRAGIEGARASGLDPAIVLHVDRGGDVEGARWFFDNLGRFALDFDRIGLSFYPWWHGTLDDLRATTDELFERTGKEVVIVETAYPWTLDWFDDTHNPVGLPAHVLPGFPATPAGQRAFTAALIAQLEASPGVVGVYWWEPAWIAAPGQGSPWENLTLFDPAGRPLPALDAFTGN